MYEDLLTQLSITGTKLVAVSKTKPIESILELYNQGQRLFGENRAQELVTKYEQLPRDIEWHMIGHLQTKKVKTIASFVSMIQSVDSIKLLREIQKQAERYQRKIQVLIQIKIGAELNKSGLENLGDVDDFFQECRDENFGNIVIKGVMGMASFVDHTEQIRAEFKQLRDCYDHIKGKFFQEDDAFSEISMGMSGDYLIAIEEGSTMVRIGSLIFGPR